MVQRGSRDRGLKLTKASRFVTGSRKLMTVYRARPLTLRTTVLSAIKPITYSSVFGDTRPDEGSPTSSPLPVTMKPKEDR